MAPKEKCRASSRRLTIAKRTCPPHQVRLPQSPQEVALQVTTTPFECCHEAQDRHPYCTHIRHLRKRGFTKLYHGEWHHLTVGSLLKSFRATSSAAPQSLQAIEGAQHPAEQTIELLVPSEKRPQVSKRAPALGEIASAQYYAIQPYSCCTVLAPTAHYLLYLQQYEQHICHQQARCIWQG